MLSRKLFQRKNFERVKCKGNYSPFDCAFISTEALSVTRKARVKKVGMLIKRRHFHAATSRRDVTSHYSRFRITYLHLIRYCYMWQQIRQVLNKNWLFNKALGHQAQQKHTEHDIEPRTCIFSPRYGISPNFLIFYLLWKEHKKVLFPW